MKRPDPARPGDGRRVLLVEDDLAAARLCREALTQGQRPAVWEIAHARDLEAVRAKRSEPFDVVLLDLDLPSSRGPETLATVLQWTSGPIVVITGTVDVDLGAKVIAPGAEEFVSRDELLSRNLPRLLEHAIVRHGARPRRAWEVVRAHLQLVKEGETLKTLAVTGRGARLGRSRDNHLSLDDKSVSRHHALVWIEDGSAWVEDLGSANGTYVNDVRITEATRLATGDRIALGNFEASVRLRDPSASLQLTEPEPEASWLDAEPTEYQDGLLPYTIDVALGGPTGSRARIDGPSGRYTIEADNRVALLYVLAQRRASDLAEGVRAGEAGWMTNQDASVAVWGQKKAREQSRSALSVLLHRVRRELDDAGFDPELIEKRRGALRLAVRKVRVR